jgi:hypothetical protein
MKTRIPLARPVAWAKAGLSGLKAFSPYAWLPILIVSIVSAVLGYRNITIQRSGNRPEMIFNRMELRNPYDDGIFSLGMLNVGTRTAYDYELVIETVDLGATKVVRLETVSSSNPIRRQGGVSAEPHLDMSKFLDVIALCSTYRDEDGNTFYDQIFISFPTMPRGLTKDKGGGGQYLAASVPPEERRKLERMKICRD